MDNFFKKLFNRPKKVQAKSFSYSGGPYSAQGLFSRASSLPPKKAIEYYTNVAPLFTAINSIASEVGGLNIQLYDERSGEYLTEHEILSLLKFPNADITQFEFFTQLSSFYKLTGNVFVVATGPINRPPLELTAINPMNVNITNNKDDGYIQTIEVLTDSGNSAIFTREESGSRFRYISGSDAEIWHIKSFNPYYGANNNWGFSELTPISFELEQYLEASTHNLSLLKRGAKPSGAIKVPEGLTDSQFDRLQQQVERFYSGSQNAGRVMLMEQGDFVDMSQSNKDMDFATLKNDITATIYSALKVPLPLVSGDYATYNNMETAQLNFYDNCVLPVAKRLLEELTVFLMDRYGTKFENMELRYNQEDIEALELRRNQQLVMLKESGVLSINELRSRLGYDTIDGGDSIYVNSNQVPVGSDMTPDMVKSIGEILDKNK